MTEETDTLAGGEGGGQEPEGNDSLVTGEGGEGQEPQADGGDGSIAGGAEPKEESNEPQGAPEEYENFKFPEGYQADEKLVEGAKAIFKEVNLSQDQAQKIIDFNTKQVQEANEAWAATNKEWVQSVKADVELGGGKFKETVEAARKATDHFGTDELKKVLNESGLGNHPEVVRMFAKVGKLIGEDGVATGVATAGAESAAARMYPTMKVVRN